MGAKRPLLLALLISVIGHMAFALLFPVPDTERRVTRFDLELIPEAPRSSPETTAWRPPEHPSERPSEAKIEPAAQTPEPPVSPPVEQSSSAAVNAELADTTPEDDEKPAAVLNLSRPADWDQIVNEITAPATGLAFNPALGGAVRERILARRRSEHVASRRAAIYGVADQDYTRTGVLGQELKMKGGCVTLREDKGVEEGLRWWVGQCTETRQNPFTLPPLEYDALGRAVIE